MARQEPKPLTPWKCRKVRNDYIIRSPEKFEDIAKVYGSLEHARIIKAAPELINALRRIQRTLEDILRSEELDELVKKKNHIRELWRENAKILKKIET